MSTLQNKTAFVSHTARQKWRQTRLEMERAEVKETPTGPQKRHWGAFKALIALFGFALRLFGLYERGVRNAIDIRLNRLDLWFETLPKEFDGFRLLQLTDLHADFLPETLQAALNLTVDVEADICVLTGDFRRRVKGSFSEILPAMERLTSQISTRHGTYAVLGNHDCADMVEPFEALGIRVLINETHTILKGGAELHLTGTDDVHYYYTDAARDALAGAPEGFKIALIHSAEFADAAAEKRLSALPGRPYPRWPSMLARWLADHHSYEPLSSICERVVAPWRHAWVHLDGHRGLWTASSFQFAWGSGFDHATLWSSVVIRFPIPAARLLRRTFSTHRKAAHCTASGS